MQALRRASFLARLVLAWFALSLGVAIASPLVQPSGGGELICSAGGVMKLLAQGDDGHAPVLKHSLNCPLCASASAPPPATLQLMQLHQRVTGLVEAAPESRIAATEAAPLPARGPPPTLVQ